MWAPPKLSSDWTFYAKYIAPGIFVLGWTVVIWTALDGPWAQWIFVLGWGIACAFTIYFAKTVKRVRVIDSEFEITDYFKTYRVPFAHLRAVKRSHLTRSPSILLTFDPPTPFGMYVRVIPPQSLFSYRECERLVNYLNSVLNQARQERHNHEDTKNTKKREKTDFMRLSS